MDKPCIFFDRDGIVNESPGPGYVERWEDFHLQPGFVAALRTVAAKGYPAVIITNQQGVAKGLYSEEELAGIHGNMRAQLRAHGVDVLDIFQCTHFASDNCHCRKPKAGMFHDAAKKHGLDLLRSWMIGDSEKDVEAGRLAGCKTIRVCPLDEGTKAEFHVESMDEVAAILEKELKPCG
ncbi:D-glycero-beta-D-manno-heptose-1,7-bisphosphate 7-phosphatase [Pontiella desulfatans]|uniref:D,D-heptose 1,7-bisphosphate phosphatase n=1 Tax=Pontiella desulfatans TaxID=2750659 RepID=A0A6C2TXF1_PONDE|nr:HAD family hydrolase [Pontiella desulfatans]VGO12204.1 D-glycero-beta-D-manno-heptose-1,7-bisphosphate 7-phosphatase [Pontiella desulfatans]